MLFIWIGFVAFVLLMLALDLGVFHRRPTSSRSGRRSAGRRSGSRSASRSRVFVYFGYENHWLGPRQHPRRVDRSAEFPDGRINDGRSAASST